MSKLHYGTDFHAGAELQDIRTGSKADYYRSENVAEIVKHGEKRLIGNKYWAYGWYATVEWNDHDEMRDYGASSKASRIVSGPYLTREEAIDAAEPYVASIAEKFAK